MVGQKSQQKIKFLAPYFERIIKVGLSLEKFNKEVDDRQQYIGIYLTILSKKSALCKDF